MMTDILQPLHLFDDQRWQACLESFLDDVSRRESHTTLVDHRTTLKSFFTPDRDPAAVSCKEVEAFCKQTPSYHGPVSHQTVIRRRQTIRGLYDHAIKQGIFIWNNPGRRAAKEVTPLFGDPNWQQCFEHYLEDLYRRSQSQATIISYTGILRRFFEGRGNPDKVTRADVSTYLQQPCVSNGKQGQPAAVATINGRVSAIRTFYDYASAYTVAGPDGEPILLFQRANPTAGIRHGQPAVHHKSLSLQEVKRFFDCMDPSDVIQARDRAIYWCYLLTCRRKSELANLRWGDIEYGLITDEDGSTREGYLFHFRGKGRQAILDSQELPEKCMEEIKHYLELSQRWETIKPEDPIFAALPNQHGPSNVKPGELRPLDASTIAKRLKHYAAQCGIDPNKFSLHSLRHTGAFLRKISGEDLFAISRALRHKSLDMTRRYLEELVTNGDRGSKLVEARLKALGVM